MGFLFWVWHFVSMGFVLLVGIKFKQDLFDLEEEDQHGSTIANTKTENSRIQENGEEEDEKPKKGKAKAKAKK